MDFPVLCAEGAAAWMCWSDKGVCYMDLVGSPKGRFVDGFLEVLLGEYQRELEKGLQGAYPRDRRGICCMCAWRERGRVW